METSKAKELPQQKSVHLQDSPLMYHDTPTKWTSHYPEAESESESNTNLPSKESLVQPSTPTRTIKPEEANPDPDSPLMYHDTLHDTPTKCTSHYPEAESESNTNLPSKESLVQPSTPTRTIKLEEATPDPDPDPDQKVKLVVQIQDDTLDFVTPSSLSPFGPLSTKPNQNLFLLAALQLLEDQCPAYPLRPSLSSSCHSHISSNSSRPSFQERPSRDELSSIILTGVVKKSKDLAIPMFSPKYMVLRPGCLSYCRNKERHESHRLKNPRMKCIPLFHDKVICRSVMTSRFHHKHVFEMIYILEEDDPRNNSRLSGTGSRKQPKDKEATPHRIRRLFMTKTEAERSLWIKSIDQATIHHPESLCSDPFTEDYPDVQAYVKCQRAIQLASNKREYVAALGLICHKGLVLPMEWTFSNPRLRHQGVTMDQVFKDLCRDRLEVNGELCDGSSSSGPESIVSTLMTHILKTANTSKTSKTSKLSEAQALRLTRDVFLRSNRTQSAGDAYELVSTLCQQEHLVVICPNSAEALPLNIHISNVASEEERLCLALTVEALIQYRICDIDPQDDAEDNWALMSVEYQQHFTYTHSGGTVVGHGSLCLSTTVME